MFLHFQPGVIIFRFEMLNFQVVAPSRSPRTFGVKNKKSKWFSYETKIPRVIIDPNEAKALVKKHWFWSALRVRKPISFPTKSGQNTIFHQPRFSWNKGISLTKPPFGVISCEVAIIWKMPKNVGRRLFRQSPKMSYPPAGTRKHIPPKGKRKIIDSKIPWVGRCWFAGGYTMSYFRDFGTLR